MSFSTTISEQFAVGFRLKSPNLETSHPWHLTHLHADFFELQAVFWFESDWLTSMNLVTHYKDVKRDIERKKTSDEVGSDSASEDDTLNSHFVEIYLMIGERSQLFKDDYPFELDITQSALRLKKPLSEKNHLYIKLLLDSNLNCFPKFQGELTKDFEKVAAMALESYLPNGKVKEFGKNSAYAGNTEKKIRALAAELNIEVREKEMLGLAKTAAQEKGLDLLTYLAFEDSNPSMIILLIQCACGKNWDGKIGETKSYLAYLDFYKLYPIHSMFLPYALLNSEMTGFSQSEKLNDLLVFERKRIIDLIQNFEPFKKLNSYEVVLKSLEVEAAEV